MNVMEDRDNNWQKDLQFLLGDTAILEQLAEQKTYIPFSEETIDFLDALYQIFSLFQKKQIGRAHV